MPTTASGTTTDSIPRGERSNPDPDAVSLLRLDAFGIGLAAHLAHPLGLFCRGLFAGEGANLEMKRAGASLRFGFGFEIGFDFRLRGLLDLGLEVRFGLDLSLDLGLGLRIGVRRGCDARLGTNGTGSRVCQQRLGRR